MAKNESNKKTIIGYSSVVRAAKSIEKVQKQIRENNDDYIEMNTRQIEKMDSKDKSQFFHIATDTSKKSNKTWESTTKGSMKMLDRIEKKNQRLEKKIKSKKEKKIYKPVNKLNAKRLRLESEVNNLRSKKTEIISQMYKLKKAIAESTSLKEIGQLRNELMSKQKELEGVKVRLAKSSKSLSKLMEKITGLRENIGEELYDEMIGETKSEQPIQKSEMPKKSSEQRSTTASEVIKNPVAEPATKPVKEEAKKEEIQEPTTEPAKEEAKKEEIQEPTTEPAKEEPKEEEIQEPTTEPAKEEAKKEEKQEPITESAKANKSRELSPEEEADKKIADELKKEQEMHTQEMDMQEQDKFDEIMISEQETLKNDTITKVEEEPKKEKLFTRVKNSVAKAWNIVKNNAKKLWSNIGLGTTRALNGMNKGLLTAASKTVEKLEKDEVTFEQRRTKFKEQYNSTLSEKQQEEAHENAKQKEMEKFEQENEINDIDGQIL